MSQRPGARRVQVGDVLEVLDQHYCYGSGLLLLRVTEVGESWQRDDEVWQELRGIQLYKDGSTPPAALPRYALVRLSGARLLHAAPSTSSSPATRTCRTRPTTLAGKPKPDGQPMA